MFTCDECGAPLECYDGEPYCPDCVRVSLAAADEEAMAEARALAALEARQLAERPPPFGRDEIPY
jgi:uncharacterized Zn finger protein (UPF0148 family)